MNEFAIELENGRQIEYALIDDVWQKVVCPNFKETMIKNSEKSNFNINTNCGCCEYDNQLVGKHMTEQFQLALETICEVKFDDLSADDFVPILNDDFLFEEKAFSSCICTHNIMKQMYVKYIPKNIVIKIGSQCIKENMPSDIRENIFKQVKDSRITYKEMMKQEYKAKIDNYNNYKFKFGKYKGKKINQVPKSYIDWILSVQEPNEQLFKVQNIIKNKYKLGNNPNFNEWFAINKSKNY
jgi:uncharacterized protein (DUF3820 family)